MLFSISLGSTRVVKANAPAAKLDRLETCIGLTGAIFRSDLAELTNFKIGSCPPPASTNQTLRESQRRFLIGQTFAKWDVLCIGVEIDANRNETSGDILQPYP